LAHTENAAAQNGHTPPPQGSDSHSPPARLQGKIGDGVPFANGPRRVAEDARGTIEFITTAEFPTRFGDFTLYGFRDHGEQKDLTAVVRGDVRGAKGCPVRVHSECHTGDIFGSQRCDCREQLEYSLEYLAKRDSGAVIYLRQEGRGIGLLNKIKAYHLQDLGLDTIEANEYLGLPADARDYRAAARIIELLGIDSIRLLTNNPLKISGLEQEGVEIVERLPVLVDANPHNVGYLKTKRDSMQHLL
jgi:GTP cyclohydrolase II